MMDIGKYGALIVVVGLAACGGGGSPAVEGTATLFQGAVNAAAVPGIRAVPLVADGHWSFVPNQMTATMTGACFIPMGETGCGTMPFASTCTVTFDPKKGSIAQLGTCSFPTTAGTYVGVQIEFSTTYQVLIDDTVNGIYTDPSQGTLLNSTMPAGGAQMVTFQDTNSQGGVNDNTTFFPAPKTFAATDSPSLSIIFDPTHWLIAPVTSGTFGNLASAGSPPVHMTLDSPGKAMLLNVYSTGNLSSAGNLAVGPPPGGLSEAKVFFSDAAGTMPISLDGPVGIPGNGPSGSHLCGIPGEIYDSAWPAAPSNCSVNGGCFGRGGYLGVDASGVMTWAMPADQWAYASYALVAQMKLPTTVGATTTLDYVCTQTVPMPANGTTYTTAPDLTALGTVQTIGLMTLVAD